MNKIFNFQSFLESVSSGKSQLFYSERFRNLIGKIAMSKDPVAQFLRQSECSEDFEDDITFIDITDKEDMVSFIQVNRLDRLRQSDRNFYKNIVYHSSDKYDLTPTPELDKYIKRVWKATQKNLEHDSWKKQRTEIGIGRFVNRVSSLQSITIKSEQLEKFVNSYKAHWKQLNKIEENFELVSGEEIRKWYHQQNYQESKGQLFSSCMKYPDCQPFFNIYVENPEVCQLLILKDKVPDKISGRALIWTLTSGEKYMDRPYTNHDADINLFNDYARKHKIRTDSDDLEVKVKAKDYGQYPYMDSLHYFNPKTGILTTDDDVYPHPDWIMLKKTDGSYQSGECVFSKYLDRYILEEEAVWAEDLEDWIFKDDAVYVDSEDAWYSEEFMDNSKSNVVYCSWADVNEFQDRCVYSTYLNSWLIKDDSKEVWVNRSQEEWVPKTARRYLSTVVEIDGEMKDCLVSAIVQDENGKWKFKS
jgi:hypothetical protein